ncbi:MAG: hypothetical protein FIA97_10490 [Methylococcaceae bacterium]|nr:hypothetical protein [Methylococcaceae bacterium]
MLTAERIEAIAEEVAGLGLSEQSLAQLRSRYGDVHFTYCMDDDVGHHQPYLSRPGLNVYLVDGRDHCLKFTGQLEHATGLVLAEVIDDE